MSMINWKKVIKKSLIMSFILIDWGNKIKGPRQLLIS